MPRVLGVTATANGPPITGYADPDGEAPWAMQLVIRIDKTDPPTRTAVCEAAATAVVRLLTDPAAAQEWAPAIERWTDGRIRKHVRRASSRPPGRRSPTCRASTVEHDGARSARSIPSATDAIPAGHRQLQLTAPSPTTPIAGRGWCTCRPASRVTLNSVPRCRSGRPLRLRGTPHSWRCTSMPADRRPSWEAHGFAVLVEQPGSDDWADACRGRSRSGSSTPA